MLLWVLIGKQEQKEEGKIGMKYIEPEMEIIKFKYQEIITASSVGVGDENSTVDGVEGGEF